MKKLRLSIVLLITTIFIFFNIERLDFQEENIIDLDTLAYLVAIAATVLTLTIPTLRRFSQFYLLSLWGGIFIFSKLISFLYFNGRPLVSGVYVYLFVTELTLLLVTVWLTHRFSRSLNEVEEAVEKLTISTHSRVRQFNDADEEIQVEMFRSRNHNRPLSIIMVQPEKSSIEASLHRTVQEIQQGMINKYVINNMAQTLINYLRRTDLILEQQEQGRFIIVCPETDAHDLTVLINYIQSVTTEKLGIPINYSMATFPNEAVTFEELVKFAEAHLNDTNRNFAVAGNSTGTNLI